MPVKNVKLGIKMALGFGVLIFIALVLGVLAMWNMSKVKDQSIKLQKEFIPEVGVANNVERNALLTMYYARSYALSEERQFLEQARKSLEEVKKYLREADAMAAQSPDLGKLREGVERAEGKIREFEQLMNETEARDDAIDKARDVLDEAAARYMKNCGDFLAIQYKLMNDEMKAGIEAGKLSERLQKIDAVQDIIDAGNAVRIANFKAQALRDPKIVQDITKNFEAIDKKLEDLRAVTRQEANLRQIAVIKEAAGTYKNVLQDLFTSWVTMQELSRKSGVVGDEILAISKNTAGAGMNDATVMAGHAVSLLSSATTIMLVGLIVAVVLGALVSVAMTRSIKGPLISGVELARRMSEGDFTQRLDIERKDEIGVLAAALNTTVSNLGGMFKEIAGGVQTLASSATELFAISQQMSSSSKQTSQLSNSVAAAAEEMSANMSSVAAATEQAATNVGTVAVGTEEMTTTIDEIARNSERGRGITSEAVSRSRTASGRVDELGKAAREIGKITETITEISEQTNLLALNATIEAARAGEAGKGFAVVANEIKELAKQTASATEEIKSKIEGIQESTGSTVTEIGRISEVINDVNEIVSTIAAAVEEQSVTTREIAGNIAQASQGVQDATANVAQSSTVAGMIAKEIAHVNQTANEMSDMSSQVSLSAEELSRLSEQLKEIVGRFKV